MGSAKNQCRGFSCLVPKLCRPDSSQGGLGKGVGIIGSAWIFPMFAAVWASCYHVFDLFTKARPPNRLTCSLTTFAASLMTYMNVIQYVQAKGME